ncbi:MAG: magnesium transporter [Hyphomonadaceae bacterium]
MAPPQDVSEAERAAAAPVVDTHLMTLVIAAAADRDGPMLRSLLAGLHPTDIADVLKNLPSHSLHTVIALVGKQLPPELLLELPAETLGEVLKQMPASQIGAQLGQFDTDDAAVVAAAVEPSRLREVLAATPEEARRAVEAGLSFEEETAGRLMQREFVAAPEFWSVGQTIDHLRDAADDDLPDIFFEIYVVDPAFRPVGAVRLSTLLRASRATALRDLMQAPQFLVRPEMDQEEVAFAFQRYHLASAPAVDEGGRLTGMVTVDDIVHVIREESEEDLLRLSGVSEADQSDSVWRALRARTPWLMVNMATALTASSVITMFETSINQMVSLAVLMPIVASLGGNAGTQSLAVAVRALAARDLTPMNTARFVGREALTGAFNGVVIALLLSMIAGVWFHSFSLALAAGLAVIFNLTCAGLAGSLVPLTLKRFGADPAVASSVFVTWMTDTVGFFAFLGIATAILFH